LPSEPPTVIAAAAKADPVKLPEPIDGSTLSPDKLFKE
ncbi:unnamed protein product, partial [marine sediment metagenome]